MKAGNLWPATTLLCVLSILVWRHAETGQGACATCVDGPEMFEHRKNQATPEPQPVTLSATDLAALQEVCLQTKSDRCFGPTYSKLSKRQLRAMNGSFVLSCDGVDEITDDYRKACIAQLQKAHAALSRRWQGTLEFLPLRESDVQPTHPCVDFVDKKERGLVDVWCWQQLQGRIQYVWSPKKGD